MDIGVKAQEASSLLLFGDSLVAGYGLQPHDSLPTQLEAMLRQKGRNIRVINGGVSGDTTSGGRSRLEWMLQKHQPDQVMIALGGNDLLRGISPKVTRANIFAMLETLQQRRYKTILSAVRAPARAGGPFQMKFDSIYVDAAQHYNVPLYPFFLEDTYGNPQLMQPDGIHPNKQGVAVIATKLADYLLKLQLQ